MDVRDAVETDADRLAALANAPTAAMRRLVRDRTVRVATDDLGSDPNADTPSEADPIHGFVGFDVRDGVVHITRLDGTETAIERLLEEPLGFAATEGLPAEILLVESEADIAAIVEGAGFERLGYGPRFDGERTELYRLEETAED
ncbi:hypothetical protein ACFQJC_16380 [Haloferax namakaokahaiae]|uniref:N-acetyltransferase domain-containing protein n=1 Tax=Haloferax namakaokahaiae TaxID=1748331 RepID=A0ABD5ZIH8_9EURY